MVGELGESMSWRDDVPAGWSWYEFWLADDSSLKTARKHLGEQVNDELNAVASSEQAAYESLRERLVIQRDERTERAERAQVGVSEVEARRRTAEAYMQEESAKHQEREQIRVAWRQAGVLSSVRRVLGGLFPLVMLFLLIVDVGIFQEATAVALDADPQDFSDIRLWMGAAVGFIVFLSALAAGVELKDRSLRRSKLDVDPTELADHRFQPARRDQKILRAASARWDWKLTIFLGGFLLVASAGMYLRLVEARERGTGYVLPIIFGMIPALVLLFEYLAYDPQKLTRIGPSARVSLDQRRVRKRDRELARALADLRRFCERGQERLNRHLAASGQRIDSAPIASEGTLAAFVTAASKIGADIRVERQFRTRANLMPYRLCPDIGATAQDTPMPAPSTDSTPEQL